MRPILFLMLFLLPWQSNSQYASFEISSNTLDPDFQAAMVYAADIWSQRLVSEVPIKVEVFFFPLGTGTFLGLTIPNGRKNFAGAPLADTWYPTALANALSGIELNPGESDMDIVINASYPYYTGLDGNVPANQYDFVSLFLHEVGHGLGIASLANVEGMLGSFGQIDGTLFDPYVTSFPFPDLQGFPGAYDRLLQDGQGQALTDTMLYPSVSPALETIFTSDDVYFSGMAGTSANGDEPVKIYAPPAFSFGSSITHLDESTYPNSSGNSLMTPFLGQGVSEQSPGPIVLGMLQDLGWTVQTVSSADRLPAPPAFSVFPTLATHSVTLQVTLTTGAEANLSLVDLTGRTVGKPVHQFFSAGKNQLELELRAFQAPSINPGLYFLVFQTTTGILSRPVIVAP